MFGKGSVCDKGNGFEYRHAYTVAGQRGDRIRKRELGITLCEAQECFRPNSLFIVCERVK